MIQMRIMAIATVCVLVFGAVVWSVDADELFEEIKELATRRVKKSGRDIKDFRADMTKMLYARIAKAKEYRRRFPAGVHLADVIADQAQASYYFISFERDKREEWRKKAFDLAVKVIKMAPGTEANAEARMLLMQFYKDGKDDKKVIEHGEILVKQFKNHFDVGPRLVSRALYALWQLYEREGKKEKADAHLQTLAKMFPDTLHGRRAVGVLAMRKLKGTAIELRFKATSGRIIDISDYKGKVLVILFWSSISKVGGRTVASLQRTERLLGARGLEVIAVSRDVKKNDMELFVDKHAMRCRFTSTVKAGRTASPSASA